MLKASSVVILFAGLLGFGATHYVKATYQQKQVTQKQTEFARKARERAGVDEATVIQDDVMTKGQRTRAALYRRGTEPGENLLTLKVPPNEDGIHQVYNRPWMTSEEEQIDADLSRHLSKTACRSEAIVIGQVVSKVSQLTEAKDFIFTDYTVRVDEVIKNSTGSPIETDSEILLTSGGGAIRMGGKLIAVTDKKAARYKANGRYVLFLKYVPSVEAYQGVTGDLTFRFEGKQVRLTDEGFYEHLARQVEGGSDSDFLSQVRTSAAHPCR